MIIFENVKMTYDEINILRNEISNGQLSLLFEGIRAHDFFDLSSNYHLFRNIIKKSFHMFHLNGKY